MDYYFKEIVRPLKVRETPEKSPQRQKYPLTDFHLCHHKASEKDDDHNAVSVSVKQVGEWFFCGDYHLSHEKNPRRKTPLYWNSEKKKVLTSFYIYLFILSKCRL